MDEIVKQLLKGASTQSTHANRLWLALAITAIVVIVPIGHTPADAGTRSLPLGLGTIPNNWFSFVASLVLNVITVAFCSAQAQTIRAQRLAHKAIDTLQSQWNSTTGIYLRDLYDASCMPSLSRVAPLAQIARGKYQFYPKPVQPVQCPTWLRKTTAILYLYLKVLAALVYYFLPAMAIVIGLVGYFRGDAPFNAIISGAVIILFSLAATLSVGVLIVVDTRYVKDVFRILYKPQASTTTGT
jgi:hypothetical protein